MQKDLLDKLHTLIREEASESVYARGRQYARSARVRSLSHTERGGTITVRGTIRGSQTYRTGLSLSAEGALAYECNCPYDYGLCKHVVALGLVFIETKYPQTEITVDDFVPDHAAQSRPPRHDDPLVRVRAELEAIGIPTAHLSEDVLRILARAKRENIARSQALKTPPVTEQTKTEPHPAKPLKDTHGLYVVLSWGSYVYDVVLTKRTRYVSGYQESLTPLLKRELAPEDRALIEDLQRCSREHRDQYTKRDINLVSVFFHALRAKVPVFVMRQSFAERSIELTWNEPKRLSIALLRREGVTRYPQYPFEEVRLSVPRFSSHDRVLSFSGPEGLIILTGATIEAHPIPEILAHPIARAVAARGWYSTYERQKPEEPATTLTDDELARLPELVTACMEYVDLAEPFPLPTLLTHTPKPVIVVDYRSVERRLSITPSVEYGGVRFAVADTVHTPMRGSMHTAVRRKDPAFGDTQVTRLEGDTLHCAPVDWKMERTLYATCLKKRDALGFGTLPRATLRGERQITEYATTYLPALKTLGYELVFPNEKPDFTRAEFRAEFDIDMDAENDWLAFDVALYCGDTRVTLADIEAFLQSGGSVLTTKEGAQLTITNPEAMRKLVDLLAHFRKGKGERYEGKAHHAPGLDAMAQSSPHYVARVSEGFKAFAAEVKKGRAVARTALPPTFRKVLRPYQKEGVYWLSFLRHYRFGGILADDMGLGKTLQALAIISMHAGSGPSLVIAPKTLLYNWEREAQTFAPKLKVAVIAGAPEERKDLLMKIRDYDLAITSYPALLKDIVLYEKMKKPFHYCVLDEAQYVKNPRTKQSHAVRKVQSEYRLALTGTPLENGVEELWAAFEFLMPGFLGHHAHFQKHFGTPIMKRADTDALAHLRAKVQCFMLRRNKSEVLKELPPKVEQVVICDLSDEQNVLYQDVLTRVRSEVTAEVKKRGFAGAQIHILAGLTRLRQLCNHPALALGAKGKKAEKYPSAKLDACLEIVESLAAEKRKVLVFSSFTEMLDIIADALKARRIGYTMLTGQTRKRKEAVEAFMGDPAITAFLVSTKAGGTGLNLTAADAVIIFDPWWNPQVERQAVDRAHRIGQKKTVHVYRLRTRGTIEEKIVALEERKAKLASAVVGENAELMKKLTWEEVRSLLA